MPWRSASIDCKGIELALSHAPLSLSSLLSSRLTSGSLEPEPFESGNRHKTALPSCPNRRWAVADRGHTGRMPFISVSRCVEFVSHPEGTRGPNYQIVMRGWPRGAGKKEKKTGKKGRRQLGEY